MNGAGDGDGDVKMEENEGKEKVVLMWGYLPGALPQRSPLLSPTIVRPAGASSDYSWRDAFGGGCGFAMAISGALFHLCVGLFLASGNLSFWDSKFLPCFSIGFWEGCCFFQCVCVLFGC